jgi:hypothetical protein
MLIVVCLTSACSNDNDAPTATAAPAISAAPSAALETGCIGGDRERQRHGSACLCCHGDEFSVAGSIDPGGSPISHIVVTDSLGDVREMAPNQFGNFFRHFTLTPPLRAVAYGIDGRAAAMEAAAPHGDCNGCHGQGLDKTAPLIHGPDR